VNSPTTKTLARYSKRAFPPYKYVPGKAPHPTHDPEGHSYNQHTKPLDSFDKNEWQSCDEYLYGIDLFNHGYWWEAHEALEEAWVAAGKKTETGLFIQGLIQISVAHLKKFQGFDIAKSMASGGLNKMKNIKGIYLGVDVTKLRDDVRLYFSDKNEIPVTIELLFSRGE